MRKSAAPRTPVLESADRSVSFASKVKVREVVGRKKRGASAENVNRGYAKASPSLLSSVGPTTAASSNVLATSTAYHHRQMPTFGEMNSSKVSSYCLNHHQRDQEPSWAEV
jgi:hypothetical protein